MPPSTRRVRISVESFRDHAERLRRKGATRVQVVDGDLCFEVEYAAPPDAPADKQPAVGFMLDMPVEYEDD